MIELEKFSPSMIMSYMSCPLAFYYQFVARIQLPQPQIHFVFGSAIHDAIDSMYNNGDTIETFKVCFDKNKLLKEEYPLYEDYLKLGVVMLQNYFKEHDVLAKLYDLNDGKSELFFKRKLVNPITKKESSLPMSGRVDRLTTTGIIVDYKTAKNKWVLTETAKMQTDLYNLWYYSEHGVVPKNTLYIILLKREKKTPTSESIQVLQHYTSLEEMASTFDETEIILQKIRNREFERPRGYHSSYCDCFKFEKRLNFNREGIEEKK